MTYAKFQTHIQQTKSQSCRTSAEIRHSITILFVCVLGNLLQIRRKGLQQYIAELPFRPNCSD